MLFSQTNSGLSPEVILMLKNFPFHVFSFISSFPTRLGKALVFSHQFQLFIATEKIPLILVMCRTATVILLFFSHSPGGWRCSGK